MKVEEDENTRKKKGQFPQALTDLQALQNVYFEVENIQDVFPSRKPEEIELTCHIIKSGAWRKLSTAKCEHQKEKRRGHVLLAHNIHLVPLGADLLERLAPGAKSYRLAPSSCH